MVNSRGNKVNIFIGRKWVKTPNFIQKGNKKENNVQVNERKLLFCNWPFWSLFKRNRGLSKNLQLFVLQYFTL